MKVQDMIREASNKCMYCNVKLTSKTGSNFINAAWDACDKCVKLDKKTKKASGEVEEKALNDMQMSRYTGKPDIFRDVENAVDDIFEKLKRSGDITAYKVQGSKNLLVFVDDIAGKILATFTKIV